MMKEKLEIILNEYNAILAFRARCIKNIDEGMRTYLIFLGFNATAISFFSNNKSPNIILIGVLLVLCCIVGFSIYQQMIATYIQMIVYTKKLNLTRKLFKQWKKAGRLLYLPITAKKPGFDKTGYTGKKFSSFGIINLIKVLNSISAAFAFYLIITEIQTKQPLGISNSCIIILSLLIGISFFVIHKQNNKEQNAKAKKKWKKEKADFKKNKIGKW